MVTVTFSIIIATILLSIYISSSSYQLETMILFGVY